MSDNKKMKAVVVRKRGRTGSRGSLGATRRITRAVSRSASFSLRDEVNESLRPAEAQLGVRADHLLKGDTCSEPGEIQAQEIEPEDFESEVRDILLTLRSREGLLRRRTTDLEARVDTLGKTCEQLSKVEPVLARKLETQETAIGQNVRDIVDLSQNYAVVEGEVKQNWTETVELNKRLGKQTEKVTNLMDEQRSLRNQIDRGREEVMQLLNRRPRIGVDRKTIPTHLELDLPVFSAAVYDRPMRFLDALSHYLEAMGETNYSFKFVIDQSLQGPARDWWEHVRERVDSIDAFLKRFSARYWNGAVQAKVKRDLEFGTYEAEGNLSRSEYVLRLYNQVKKLSDPPAEAQVVEKFSRHFDEQVQQSVISRGTTTIDALIALLDTMDQIGSLNSLLTNTCSFERSRGFVGRNSSWERAESAHTRPAVADFRSSTPTVIPGRGEPLSSANSQSRERVYPLRDA